jgi:periplasmic protein CpxP/Spy
MKRVFCAVAALFCMTILFSSPLMAQTGTEKAQGRMTKVDRTEAQITDLHTKLQITPAQEDQWNKVALAMRENAAEMDILVFNRKAKLGTMNAVDNLKSYKDVSDAHTTCLVKFIAAFEPLYASMSDTQKANADAIFSAKMARQGQHRGHKHTTK